MNMGKLDFPLAGCRCNACESARAEQSRARPLSPLGAAAQDLYDRLSTIKPVAVPFEPEPVKAEPVYTHVLLDYDEDGTPGTDMAELHTAESLIEAIAWRKDQDERFVVYRLGESILDVSPA